MMQGNTSEETEEDNPANNNSSVCDGNLKVAASNCTDILGTPGEKANELTNIMKDASAQDMPCNENINREASDSVVQKQPSLEEELLMEDELLKGEDDDVNADELLLDEETVLASEVSEKNTQIINSQSIGSSAVENKLDSQLICTDSVNEIKDTICDAAIDERQNTVCDLGIDENPNVICDDDVNQLLDSVCDVAVNEIDNTVCDIEFNQMQHTVCDVDLNQLQDTVCDVDINEAELLSSDDKMNDDVQNKMVYDEDSLLKDLESNVNASEDVVFDENVDSLLTDNVTENMVTNDESNLLEKPMDVVQDKEEPMDSADEDDLLKDSCDVQEMADVDEMSTEDNTLIGETPMIVESVSLSAADGNSLQSFVDTQQIVDRIDEMITDDSSKLNVNVNVDAVQENLLLNADENMEEKPFAQYSEITIDESNLLDEETRDNFDSNINEPVNDNLLISDTENTEQILTLNKVNVDDSDVTNSDNAGDLVGIPEESLTVKELDDLEKTGDQDNVGDDESNYVVTTPDGEEDSNYIVTMPDDSTDPKLETTESNAEEESTNFNESAEPENSVIENEISSDFSAQIAEYDMSTNVNIAEGLVKEEVLDVEDDLAKHGEEQIEFPGETTDDPCHDYEAVNPLIKEEMADIEPMMDVKQEMVDETDHLALDQGIKQEYMDPDGIKEEYMGDEMNAQYFGDDKNLHEVIPVALNKSSEFQNAVDELIVPASMISAADIENMKSKDSEEIIISDKCVDISKLKSIEMDDGENENDSLLAPQIYACSICHRAYQSVASLQRHEKAHYTENGIVLTPTSSSMGNVDEDVDLNSDVANVTSVEGMYSCTCGKMFKRRSTAMACMKSHRNRGIWCEICVMAFRRRRELRSHILRVHSKGAKIIKPKCEICHKYFAHQRSLVRHMKLHYRDGHSESGAMDFGDEIIGKKCCLVCNLEFETDSELELHKSIAHPLTMTGEVPSKTPTDEKPQQPSLKLKFNCKTCKKVFLTLGALTSHKAQHSKKKFVSNVRKRQYSKENVDEAVKFIKEKGGSKREAAKRFGVPRSTIHYKLNNPEARSKSGPHSILSDEEEKKIVTWLIDSDKNGFTIKREDLQDCVQKILMQFPRENPFINNRPGNGWYKSFLKRHPVLDELTPTRASAQMSEGQIRSWFAEIEKHFKEASLEEVIKDPKRVFNGDETSFKICPKTRRVIAYKRMQKVNEVEKTSEESITVLFSFSADGETNIPMIIFPYQKIPYKILKAVPKTWGIGQSESGYTTAEVFHKYISDVFHPLLLKNHTEFPVILFVDGHKTHLSLEVSELCSRLEIHLIALYPNLTHIIQPADVEAFRPIKAGWKKVVNNLDSNNRQLLNETSFAPLLENVIKEYVQKDALINGFRVSGLFPFNPNNVDFSNCLRQGPESVATQNSCTTTNTTIDHTTFRTLLGDETYNRIKHLSTIEEQSTNNISEETQALIKLMSFFNTKNDQILQTNVDNLSPNESNGNMTLKSDLKDTTIFTKELRPNSPKNKGKRLAHTKIMQVKIEKQKKVSEEKEERKRKGLELKSKQPKRVPKRNMNSKYVNPQQSKSRANPKQIAENKTCTVCSTVVIKNELTCSKCSKDFHRRCIPRFHRVNIPEDQFLCQLCIRVDDSDSFGTSDEELLAKK